MKNIIGHSVEYSLPEKLEDFIFNNLLKGFQGKLPDYKDAENEVEADETKVKGCLAKYFAGSFKELKEIFKDLLNVKIINETFKNKENINILDIGSGSGGNLMGLLYCLEKNKILDNNKKVSVISIDGNEFALKYQKIMIEKFFPQVSLQQEEKKFESNEDFENQINEIVSGNKFDIIMSFQFVNELYRKNYEESSPLYYRSIMELAYEHLRKDGLFILSDVNYKLGARHFSQLMNFDIIPYLQEEKETGLKCIVPLSCAFWYKKCRDDDYPWCFQQRIFNVRYRNEGWFKNREEESKRWFRFVYKVFVHNELADKIFSHLEKKDIYRVSNKSEEINFCDKGERKLKGIPSDISPEKQKNAADAFTLSSSLKQTK